MQKLDPLVMLYFDPVVVFVTNFSHLLRLALNSEFGIYLGNSLMPVRKTYQIATLCTSQAFTVILLNTITFRLKDSGLQSNRFKFSMPFRFF